MQEMLRGIPLFAGLGSAYMDKIAEECAVSTFPAGTILFHEKEVGMVLYFIVSGYVKVYSTNRNGEVIILSIMSAGDTLGELSLLDGKPRSASAQVVEDTKVISLTQKSFNELLRNNIGIALQLVKDLSFRLRSTNEQLQDLTYLDTRKRVMKKLIKLANNFGTRDENYIRFKISLNYDEIAQLAGVTKPQLFQSFQELQNKGILTVSGNEFVLHLHKLK